MLPPVLPSELDNAYMAGIVDGEGTLGIYKANGYFMPRMVIFSTTQELILHLQRLYGGTILTKKPKKSVHSTCYELRFQSYKHLREILEKILPYMIIKKQQAQIIYEFTELMMNKKYGVRDEDLEDFQEELRELVYSLNLKGPR